jgi:hypothetical protein
MPGAVGAAAIRRNALAICRLSLCAGGKADCKRLKRRCLRCGHGYSCFVGSARPPARCGGALTFLAKCDIFHVGSHRNLQQGIAGSSVVAQNAAHWERFS